MSEISRLIERYASAKHLTGLIAATLVIATTITIGFMEIKQSQQPIERVVVDGTVVEEKDQALPEVNLTSFTSTANQKNRRLTIQVPVDAVVNELDGEIIVTYTGINETLEDKVVDGYEIAINLYEDTTFETALAAQSGVIALQPTVLSGKQGYVFLADTPKSEVPVDHVLLFIDSNTVVAIRYSVAGQNQNSHRETILEIVKSIKIE